MNDTDSVDHFVSLNLFWRTVGGLCAIFLTTLLSILVMQREQTNRDFDTTHFEIRGVKEDIRVIQRELIRAGVITNVEKQENQEKLDKKSAGTVGEQL